MLKLKMETEFKDTEIGKVPKDWGVIILNSVANINKKIKMNINETSSRYRFISM